MIDDSEQETQAFLQKPRIIGNHLIMVDALDLLQVDTKTETAEPESLAVLKQSFFKIAGAKLEELQQTDFLELRKNNPSTGNVINYVAGLLEIYTNHFGEFEERESDLRESLHTAIVEHALADAVGEFTFTNQWVWSEGRLRLGTHSGFLDEIIARSIDDKTGQIPQFEIERNKMDARIINILTEVRNSGSTETVVKFSPSPVNIHDPEVRKRGYQGNAQICLFELTPDGEERQTIYWFPQVNRTDYLQLAQQLIDADPAHVSSGNLRELLRNPYSQQLDLEVMAYSDNFSPKQIETIKQFIGKNQRRLEINRPIILNYANTTIRQLVNTALISQVYRAATTLLHGNDPVALTQALQEIFTLIEQAQFDFRLFNRDYGGINTFDDKTSLALANTSWKQFQQADRDSRLRIQFESGFRGTGCGFSADIRQILTGTKLWGPMSPGAGFTIPGLSYPENFGEPHYGVCGGKTDKGCQRYTIVGGCELCQQCHYKY